jgi:diguanylate cyclase (GGDEF)-like protein
MKEVYTLHSIRIYFLLLICVINASVHAQDKLALDAIASYDDILNNYKEPLNRRIEVLLAATPGALAANVQKAKYHDVLGRLYNQATLPAKALEQISQGLNLIELRVNPKLYFELKLSEADALNLIQKGESVIPQVEEAISWAIEKADIRLELRGLMTQARIYLRLRRYSLALDSATKAYAITKKLEDAFLSSQVAEVIANLYDSQNNLALAKQFYIEATNFARIANDNLGMSFSLFGLGRINLNLKEYESAREHLVESKKMARLAGDRQGVAYASDFLSLLEYELENYDLAEQHQLKALGIFSEGKSVFSERRALASLMKIAVAQMEVEKAQMYYEQKTAHSFQSVGEAQLLDESEIYARLLALQSKFKEAFDLLNDTSKKKQAYYSKRSKRLQTQLREQFESEAKVKEAKLLNSLTSAELQFERIEHQQKTRQWVMLLVFVLLSIFFIAWLFRAKRKKSLLVELANTDGLSELSNRRRTLELMNHQVQLSKRHNAPFTAAVIDIDHFKKINDTLGHAAGDAVLKGFGRLCKTMFRHTDIIGRIGGEEFVIGFPHTSCLVAESALVSFSKKFETMGESLGYPGLSLSVSIGCAQLDEEESAESLIAHCDKALYEAKESGRNQVKIYLSQK